MEGVDAVSSRTEHAWHTHTYLNEYIKFADAKTGLVMAVAGALSVFIVQSTTFWNGATSPFLGYIAAGCLGLSFVSGLLVISPVLYSIDAIGNRWRAFKQSVAASSAPTGLIFWNEILSHGTCQAYSEMMDSIQPRQLLEEVSKHNFMLASILRRKYFWLNSAIYLMVIGIATMIIFFALNGWDFSLRGAESLTKK